MGGQNARISTLSSADKLAGIISAKGLGAFGVSRERAGGAETLGTLAGYRGRFRHTGYEQVSEVVNSPCKKKLLLALV